MNDSTKNDILKRHNVQVWGSGSITLLFAHGMGCDQKVWHSITPAFEADYTIVAFDYIGSGRSDWSAYNKDKYSSLHGYAADVQDICAALALQNVVLVAHSVSSIIGMLAAIANPALFNAIVMIGPSPCYINGRGYTGGFERGEIETLLGVMETNYRKWASAFAPLAMGNADKPELSQDLNETFCSADPAITLDFARLTFLSDNRNDLPKLQTPCLILQTAEDIVAPLSVGAYMHQAIPGSTLVNMKATGHFPHLSAPEETAHEIKQYLEKEQQTGT
jgi:sigma-B regulation protein RsbQ